MLTALFTSLSIASRRGYRAVPLIAMANRPRRNLPTAAQAASLATTMQSTEAAFESFVEAQPAVDPVSVTAASEAGSSMTSPPSSPLSEAVEAEEPKKPARKKRAKKEPELDEDGNVIKKTRAKRTPAPPEYDEDGNVIKKKRQMKPKPPVVYVIPDVEKKTTTFKGRLGYACLNTVLRGTKPDSIFCSRTCRIASIEKDGRQIMYELAIKNVKDLKTMIQWNEDNKIKFMRMSSEMFPFASHKIYGYDLSFADKELKEAGDLAKSYGHRLTMHPGQFTQLGSPKEAVVEASVRELEYQCEIMDRMGLDQDGVMIIHMGGVYGDKPTTLARFKENYITKLPDKIKKRLVLENDEICYNVDDIMPVCNELEIPIIFDYHHDWINPSSKPPAELIPLIAETWKKRGIKMKQHLSEPRPGAVSVMERRAHSDRCQTLPDCLPDDVDLMIEAKDKEQAVFELYRIYGLHDVIHDNLRPPNENPSMHTNGRKSSLKKKVKPTGEVDEDGESIELEDVEKEGDGGLGDEGVEMNGQVRSRSSTPKPAIKKRGRPAKVKDEEESPLKKKGKTTNGQAEGAKAAPRKRASKVKTEPEQNGDDAGTLTPAAVDESAVKAEPLPPVA